MANGNFDLLAILDQLIEQNNKMLSGHCTVS